MTSENYPSTRTVSYSYDYAGRLNTFSGTLGDALSRTYATVTQYNAANQKERESYGTGTNGITVPLYLKLHYNKRLQMADLRLGSVNDEWNWNRGALIFYYGTGAVSAWNPFADDKDNNGNVRRALHYVPLNDAISSYVIPQLQDYQYDNLNRITNVTEIQQNSGGGWSSTTCAQGYGYDRYGNRSITSVTGPCNGLSLSFSQTTNRITTANYSYDSAGNLTNEGGASRTYDAENRMVSATGGAYVYDGNGKRVKRTASSQEWWYVYGIGGELLAEYLSTAPTTVKKEYGYRDGKLLVVWDADKSGDERLKWLVTDHLGSTRMEADKSGRLNDDSSTPSVLEGIRRHDYLPFGEELNASVGAQRSVTGVGYEPPASNMRMRFTDKERDTETGLDYFGARYFASVQGRFTGVDPIFIAPKRLIDPQAINLYAYTRNNPLKFVDPDGRYFVGANGKKVGFKISDNGKMVLGKNASADLVRMARLINKTGSETALAQFAAAATNETRNNFKIAQEEVKNNLNGLHQAHDKSGKPLVWEEGTGGTGKFNGQPDYIKDKNGNMVYKETSITIFEGNMNKDEVKANQELYADPGLTKSELMVGVFAHEIDHNTNQAAIDAIRTRQEGGRNNLDVEKPADAVEEQTLGEIKKKRPKPRG